MTRGTVRSGHARRCSIALLACAVPAVSVADPCLQTGAAGFACELQDADFDLPAVDEARTLRLDDTHARPRARLRGRWYLGRDDRRDFGLVREGEGSQISLTRDGVRLTVRF